jgi:hypothetical protein
MLLPFFESFTSISIPNSACVGALLVLGLLANSTLLMNAQKDFEKCVKNGSDLTIIKSKLENKASPSMKLGIFSFIGYTVLTIGIALLVDLTLGLPG